MAAAMSKRRRTFLLRALHSARKTPAILAFFTTSLTASPRRYTYRVSAATTNLT